MAARRRRKLATARKAAGYTQEGLAEALRVDRSTVQRWEAGEHAPWPYLWPKLGRLLGVSRVQLQALFADEAVRSRCAPAPGTVAEFPPSPGRGNELVSRADSLLPVLATTEPRGSQSVADPASGLLAHLAAASAGTTGVLSAQGVDAHILTDYLCRWATDVNRRELIRLLGVATANLAVPPLLAGLDSDEQDRVARAVVVPSRIDEQTIRHLEAVLYSAMHQDDALGPQAALDTVLAQRKLVHNLLAECPSDLQRSLLILYSNMSRFAGWLWFDLADFETARSYYEQARLAAHEAEHTDLSVAVLCNMSHLATWQGRPRVGIDHAMAARNWADDTDDHALRAYTADVAARAYAELGDERACLAALDNAQTGVTDAGPQTPATSLVYFYGPGQLASTRSLCLLQLGEAAQAERAAQESLALVSGSFVRNRAFSTIDLGNAYLAAGAVDEAARVIGDGAALAARNRSARLVATLGQARAGLQRWKATPAVRELDDRLVAYGLASSSTT